MGGGAGRRWSRQAARLAVACLLLCWCALLALRPESASAHALDPGVRTVLDAVEPPMAGVAVQAVVSVAPQLVLDNSTSDEVQVLAPTGEPFLRIGAGGTLGNFASPTWYLSNSPNGVVDVPASATPGAAPRWLPVSSGGSWGWYDHRIHPRPQAVPADVAAGRATVRLYDWSVPVRFRGALVAIRGHEEFKRLLGVITAQLTSAAEPVSGVQVTVLPGVVPGLHLGVRGSVTVLVLGPRGEPFARVSATRSEVNLRSPEWVDVELASGRTPEVAADPASPPQWSAVGGGSFGWVEPRAAYPHEDAPDAVVAAGRAAVLSTWSVPIEVDGAPLAITGTTGWTPAPAAPTVTPPPAAAAIPADTAAGGVSRWVALAVVAAVALAAVAAVRLRAALRRG